MISLVARQLVRPRLVAPVGAWSMRAASSDSQPRMPTSKASVGKAFAKDNDNMNKKILSEEAAVNDDGSVTAEIYGSFMDMPMDMRLKEAVTQDFKYTAPSPIQQMCFETCLKEQNVILKSKTGTGTMAFLLPIITKHFKEATRIVKKRPSRVPVLVITPTRELAKQVEIEGDKLLKRFPRSLYADSCIGGTARGFSIRRMERRPPFILAATPGRLLDMMDSAGWDETFEDLKVLVLDEADRLLDMGFRAEIEGIVNRLNRSEKSNERQTVILSATMGEDVENIEKLAFCGDSAPCLVNVPQAEGAPETAESVTQFDYEASMENLLPSLHTIIHDHIEEQRAKRKDSKVVVFFNTTAQTQFFSEIFSRDAFNLYTLHSKMQQSKRDKIRGTFKSVRRGVLFTTDVSARGVDYPDVSLVVQVGIPKDRETYIHRVGRTGRGGSEGSAVLITTPEEKKFLNKHLRGLPMAQMDVSDEENNFATSKKFINTRLSFLREYDNEKGEETFGSFIGFYRGVMGDLGMRPKDLLKFAEDYATQCLLLDEVPHMSEKYLKNLGLSTKSPKFRPKRNGRNERRNMPRQYTGNNYRARNERAPSSYKKSRSAWVDDL
eukprot:m.188299 g.188299  ORF g.188299 m.188299 type:complete len:607 (-) comp13629_c0_seq2:222-2042(-)